MCVAVPVSHVSRHVSGVCVCVAVSVSCVSRRVSDVCSCTSVTCFQAGVRCV